MTKALSIFLCAVLLALPFNAYAVDIELRLIPEGKLLTVEEVTYRCYTFEEWKTLVELDHLAFNLAVELVKLTEVSMLQNRQISGYEQVIKLQVKQLAASKDRITKLGKDYLKLSEDLKKAEKGDIWAPIMIGAGALLATVGVTAYALSRAK